MNIAPGEVEAGVSHAVVVGIWAVIGLLAVLGGLAGIATSVVGDSVAQVPVRVTTSFESGGVRPCAEQQMAAEAGPCPPPDGWPADMDMITLPIEDLTLDVVETSWQTRLLAGAPIWVGLLTGGTAVLLLVPVIRNTAQGRRFADHSASRLAGATGVVAAGWAIATLAWFYAAHRAVDRLEGLAQSASRRCWPSAVHSTANQATCCASDRWPRTPQSDMHRANQCDIARANAQRERLRLAAIAGSSTRRL